MSSCRGLNRLVCLPKHRPLLPALAAAMLALQLSGAAAAPAAPGAAASTAVAPAPAKPSAGELRWDLRDLYPSDAAWDTAYAAAKSRVEALDRFKPTVTSSAAGMRDALVAISDVQREAVRLGTYAGLKTSENLREPRAQERQQQSRALYALLGEKTAWLAPAVQSLGAERVQALIAGDPVLKSRFDLQLDDLLRNAAHTLSPDGEALLAAAGPVLGQPGTVFSQLSDSELPQNTVTLSNGKKVVLSTAAYEANRNSPNRADRKKVFDGFFGAFKKVEGTLGANLGGTVLANVFQARARKFGGSLEAALFGDNMPPAVYRTLVEQANAGLPTLHRYLKLRARLLGLPLPLAYYDNYPRLVPTPRGESWTIERSKAMTLQALAPMGDDYLSLMRQGFTANWIDSHPRPGKTSGAYMSGGAYDVHPFVLLNHNDDLESLSTLAHEFGHAVHTQLSNAQPYEKSGYSTFIAESASIANEMLLNDYLVANAKTSAEKMYYLTQGLESIRTTFFRQVMFAEFQLAMHEEVEKGQSLSGPRLSELYCGIAKRYYGEAQGVMNVDPAYCVEWAYVGHFYSGFYVWQYATSMVGAAQFSDSIQQQGSQGMQGRERFINLLKAGSSDYAYKLYVRAGIDLAQPAPYQALMARMTRLMDELERLAAQQRKPS